jgi:hypothetical protein
VRQDDCSQAGPSKTGRSAAVPSAVSLTAAFPEIARAVPPEDRRAAEHTLIAPVLAARDEDLAWPVLVGHHCPPCGLRESP